MCGPSREGVPAVVGKAGAHASARDNTRRKPMLSEDELRVWLERSGLPEPARDLIRRVRSSEPSRHVGSWRGNVSGRYPSKKMGVTIQFESHRVELAAIYEMETDR